MTFRRRSTDIADATEPAPETDRWLRMALKAARMVAWEFNPATDGIVASDNLAELYGLKPGSTFRMDQGFAFVHPEDRERHQSTVARALTAGRDYLSVFRLIRPIDGRVIWLEERGQVMLDDAGHVERLYGVVADITERKIAEEKLQAADAQFRTLADNMLQFTWTADASGWIYWYNQRWYDYTGTTFEEMQGWGWKSVHHPDYVDGVVARFQASLAQGEPWEDTFPLCGKDGQYRWFLSRAQPIRTSDGKLLHWFGTNTDITEQRETAEKLRQLVAQLSDADHRKDEFLSILAHELRNPLAPISNGLQLMKLAKDDVTAVDQARAMMERQLAVMVRLVDDLMDIGRITQGKFELRRKRVELADVAQQAIETSRPLIETNQSELVVNISSDPIYVDGDAVRLAQVLSNLLSNAAKYSERGGRIALTIKQDEGEALLSVQDTGIGIPESMLPRVFELFTQLDRSLEKSQGGLGIGLSLVKGLVELHGGSVEALSAGADQGSIFTVRLPIASSSTPLPEEVQRTVRPVLPGRRILIADDNADSASTLSLLLEFMEHKVWIAEDGKEAVAKAEALRPDLILLDIGMPKLNGYEACRLIREQAWGRNIVVAALTGWGQKEDRQRSADAGFDAHLVKPIDAAELEQLLVKFPTTGAVPASQSQQQS